MMQCRLVAIFWRDMFEGKYNEFIGAFMGR